MGADITISVRGKPKKVPLIHVGHLDIITRGKWIKVATVRDEEYAEGLRHENPEQLIERYYESGGQADIFCFSAQIPDTEVQYDYPIYWDNAAVIPIGTYEKWWNDLCQVARRNVRLATKRGVTVSVVPFDDKLINGITAIYNETPVRQGRKFWHFGKDAKTVGRENASFPDRSIFIGAFVGSELIGFIKLVSVNSVASIMQILANTAHQDKRTTNALIAKAVEVCAERGFSHLQYCNFVYHENYDDPLTDFKRRNGFIELRYPRYFIPLTSRGRVVVACRLHLGLAKLLPKAIVLALLKARAAYHTFALRTV